MAADLQGIILAAAYGKRGKRAPCGRVLRTRSGSGETEKGKAGSVLGSG